jgi:hypothetical protein
MKPSIRVYSVIASFGHRPSAIGHRFFGQRPSAIGSSALKQIKTILHTFVPSNQPLCQDMNFSVKKKERK